MPLDEDTYPTESGRRRFVKGVVGSAALSSVGAGGVAALDATTGPQGVGGGRTEFYGIENTDGPAPRGMPIIPITIENGQLKGQPPSSSQELSDEQKQSGFNGSGVPYTFQWFQYCGIQSYAGIDPGLDADNWLRASGSPPGTYGWQQEVNGGTTLTKSMFEDYKEWGNGIGKPGIGKPAMATWRSQGENAQTIPVQVLRSERIGRMARGEGEFSNLSQDMLNFLQGAIEDDFIAWLNKCTHFCCAPGFKHLSGSAKFDAENKVYCGCHQSVYDPFSPVRRDFVALPRPEE